MKVYSIEIRVLMCGISVRESTTHLVCPLCKSIVVERTSGVKWLRQADLATVWIRSADRDLNKMLDTRRRFIPCPLPRSQTRSSTIPAAWVRGSLLCVKSQKTMQYIGHSIPGHIVGCFRITTAATLDRCVHEGDRWSRKFTSTHIAPGMHGTWHIP